MHKVPFLSPQAVSNRKVVPCLEPTVMLKSSFFAHCFSCCHLGFLLHLPLSCPIFSRPHWIILGLIRDMVLSFVKANLFQISSLKWTLTALSVYLETIVADLPAKECALASAPNRCGRAACSADLKAWLF